MESDGGYDVHRGVIAKEHRLRLYSSVAQCHVHTFRLHFPKIGTIVKCTETGTFYIGPIPHIGGPFETESAFFEAWDDTVKFRLNRQQIVQMVPPNQPELAKRVAVAIENFPTQVKVLFTRRLPPRNEGPFPLVHTDFLHSNILVDSEFSVVGVIDWEGAQMLPWECVTFPDFLECMPPAFDVPAKYDDNGQPFDDETREVWE